MTYPTYQAAKIANPESEILKARDDWEGCQELIGKFIANKPNPQGEPYIGKGWFEICNPADYCMTVKQFLDAGHKFVDGDIYLYGNTMVYTVYTIKEDEVARHNLSDDNDDNLYILKAKALEETNPTYRYDKVEFEEDWEYFKLMSEDGDLYVNCVDSTFEGCYGDNINLANAIHEGVDLYRRIEVTERDEFIEEGLRVWGKKEITIHDFMDALYKAGCRFVNGKG